MWPVQSPYYWGCAVGSHYFLNISECYAPNYGRKTLQLSLSTPGLPRLAPSWFVGGQIYLTTYKKYQPKRYFLNVFSPHRGDFLRGGNNLAEAVAGNNRLPGKAIGVSGARGWRIQITVFRPLSSSLWFVEGFYIVLRCCNIKQSSEDRDFLLRLAMRGARISVEECVAVPRC